MVTVSKPIDKANKATLQYLREELNRRHITPALLASKFNVTEAEAKSWMTESIPYEVFLQVCVLMRMKVTDVFNTVKNRMAAEKNQNKTPEQAPAPEPAPVEEAPVAAPVEESAPPVANEPAVPDNFAASSQATSPSAPNVDDLTTIDFTNPDELPFDNADDTSVKDVDTVLMDWPSVMDKFALASKLSIIKVRKALPRPVRADDHIVLEFPREESKNKFVSAGYLDKINNVVKSLGYDTIVTAETKK